MQLFLKNDQVNKQNGEEQTNLSCRIQNNLRCSILKEGNVTPTPQGWAMHNDFFSMSTVWKGVVISQWRKLTQTTSVK